MKTRKFITAALLTILAAIIFISCSKSNSNNNAQGTTISITSSGFSPATLTVVTGSSVTWKNNDSTSHSISSSDGSISSGTIAAGSSYSKTFSSVGTFNYFDATKTSMTGVLIVAASMSGGGY
ncbi:MAG TPA: cupredoxin domain-containing protein [Puia sp.]|jgi:plastocyanin|nr:cupredoxin domain-containing protein [Puia sp.]